MSTGTLRPGMAPSWLLRPQLGPAACGCAGKLRRGSFLEKTIAGSVEMLRNTILSQEMASRDGLLQRRDPRMKLVALLVALTAVGLLHHIPVLAGAYLLTVLLALGSRLPAGLVLKRVWLAVPLFTGIVVLPATLSIVTAGQVVLPLWRWDGVVQGVTAPGLTAAMLVLLRVATSISLVLLLTLTTGWTSLLAALRALAVPRIFIMITTMAYRFIFLLLGTVTDMYTARKSRTLGTAAHDRTGRAFVAAGAGHLLSHAGLLSEQVHQAMVARGYRGEPVSLARLRFSAADAVGMVLVLAVAGACMGADVFLGR